jgi:hypothetical protein
MSRVGCLDAPGAGRRAVGRGAPERELVALVDAAEMLDEVTVERVPALLLRTERDMRLAIKQRAQTGPRRAKHLINPSTDRFFQRPRAEIRRARGPAGAPGACR